MKKRKENFLSFRITCLQNSAIVITTLDKYLYSQCNRRNRLQKYKLSLHYYMMFGCQQNLISSRCGGWHQRWRNTMALFSAAYSSMSRTTFWTFLEFYRMYIIWKEKKKIVQRTIRRRKRISRIFDTVFSSLSLCRPSFKCYTFFKYPEFEYFCQV